MIIWEKLQTKKQQIYLTIVAVISWFALVTQFYLLVINRSNPISETIIRFFSYFTILTNLFVALCATVQLMNPKSGAGKFFSKPTTLTAIAVYIMMVGIVYNIILRFTWNPQGMQMIVDEFLHSVIPVVFLLYWLLFTPKGSLQWKNIFSWLIYPLIYILLILIRGALSGFYPYPFIDVKNLGYNRVLLHSCGLFIAFLFLSLLLVAISKMMRRNLR